MMLELIKSIIEKSKAVKQIDLSVVAFYDLLTDLPELPEPTGVVFIDEVPIVLKPSLKKRKILIKLKR